MWAVTSIHVYDFACVPPWLPGCPSLAPQRQWVWIFSCYLATLQAKSLFDDKFLQGADKA
jgi:hypothetical protein